jgi:hypothetical protein
MVAVAVTNDYILRMGSSGAIAVANPSTGAVLMAAAVTVAVIIAAAVAVTIAVGCLSDDLFYRGQGDVLCQVFC